MARRRERRSQVDARQQRKMERATRHTFSSAEAGAQGQSITEMLEERLFDAGRRLVNYHDHLRKIDEDGEEEYTLPEWVNVKSKRAKDEALIRGELRGEAIGVALMRHPQRRYETAWWNYVKKLERRAVKAARDAE